MVVFVFWRCQMKAVKFSEDIVPIGEFKSQSAQWLAKVRKSGQPIVITQNGKPAGILISPAEYDHMREKELFIKSVKEGLVDADDGRVIAISKVKAELNQRRKSKGRK